MVMVMATVVVMVMVNITRLEQMAGNDNLIHRYPCELNQVDVGMEK